MSLDSLEKELYRENSDIIKRRNTPQIRKEVKKDSENKAEITNVWQEIKEENDFSENSALPNSPEPSKKTFRKLFFLPIGLLILVITVGIIFLIFSKGNNNGKNSISLSIDGPKEVNRGVPFEITVNIQNQLDTLISNPVLSLNLPNGIVYLNALGDSKFAVEKSIGDIGVGSLAKETFQFLPVGEENSLLKINVKLIYTSGSKTRFEANEVKEIFIRNSGIKLEVKKPEFLLQGSTFEFEVSYKNTSDFSFPEVILEARYPTSFKFVSASLTPDSLNNYWQLGALKAGSTGKIQIKGLFNGETDTRLNIPIVIYARFSGQNYELASDTVTLEVAPSPINLKLLINNQENYIAKIGDSLNYSIKYQNNSGIALADLVVKATPIGELFDQSTLYTNGTIDYTDGSITWNASQVPELKLLSPGAAGEINFSIKLKQQFPIRRMNDKNFYIRVNVEVNSPSVPYYLSATKTRSSASLETKVAGLVFFDAQAFYRDASTGIVNSGKIPLQVGKATDFTIHWIIKNFSTDIKNISVKSTLKPGILWTGVVKSNIDSKPIYNDRTGEITWNIDKKIQATTGIISEPVEAVFQIRVTPNQNDIGRTIEFLDKSLLTAIDDFTGITISVSDEALDSTLPDDPTVKGNSGVVMP